MKWKNTFMVDDCLDRYRLIWPDLRTGDVHAAPAGVQ
jgi:hypothetical protein